MNYSYFTDDLMQEWATSELDVKEELEDEALRDAAILREINEFYERNAQSSNVLTNFLKSLIFGIDEPREVRLNEVNAIVEYMVNMPCEHFQHNVEAREFTRLIETAIDEEWDYFQRGNGESKKFIAMRALPPIYYVSSVENRNASSNKNEDNEQLKNFKEVKQKETEQSTLTNENTLCFYHREKIVFRVWYTDVAGCAASLCVPLLTQLTADDAIVIIVSELQHCDHVEPWLHYSSEHGYIAILRVRALNEYIYGHARLSSFHAVHQMICTNQDELAVVIEKIDADVITAPRFTPSLPNYLLPNFTHAQLTSRRVNEAISLWTLHEPFSLYIPMLECVNEQIHKKEKNKNATAVAASTSSSAATAIKGSGGNDNEQVESENVNTSSVMAVIVEMYFGVERCCPPAITSWQGKVKEQISTLPTIRGSEAVESLSMASSLLSSFVQSKQQQQQQEQYYHATQNEESQLEKEQYNNNQSNQNSDVAKKQTISRYYWSESEKVQLDVAISHIPREAKLCFTLVKAASEKVEVVEGMSANEILQCIHEVKKKGSDASKQLITPVGYVTLSLFDIHAEMQRGMHTLHLWPWATTNLLRFSTCHGSNNNYNSNNKHIYSTDAVSPSASTLANNSMTIKNNNNNNNNYSLAFSSTNKYNNNDYSASFTAFSAAASSPVAFNTTGNNNLALGKSEEYRGYYNDEYNSSNVAEKMNSNADKNVETFRITCVLSSFGKRVVFPSGRPPHVLRKASEEAWHAREVKLSRHLKCDEVEQLRQLYRIFHYDALHDLSEDDKILLWKYREVLVDCPKALPWILRAVNWMQPFDVYEMHILLHRWRELSPLDALQLLDARFADSVARSFATRCIDMMNDLVLRSCLLQLIQVVKIELYHYSSIARLLLRRALASPYVIAHNLFWFLVSEVDNAMIRERFALILRELVMYCPLRRSWLRQVYVCKELIRAAIKVQKVNKRQRVQALHSFLSTVHLPHRFTLPLHPSMECCGLHINQCNVMDSKKFPLWLVFRNYHDAERSFTVIYKTGDDLRQDLLTLQLLELMDSIWKANGLDMHLTSYGCVSTGEEVGLIEVVLNSDTIANITRKDGGAQAAFDEYPLLNWLRLHNSTRRAVERCTINFVHSTAGYIVASYILGIGDRHNDNIMIREDGTLFHIDFGHFLGNYKKKFGFKRETTPFVFTPMYLKVMGGSSSGVYRYFVSLALHAYNVMRHHGNLLIMLFLLMLPTGIAELQSEEDITYLRDALQMDKTDAVAKQHYRTLINESLNNKRTLINDYIHIRAH